MAALGVDPGVLAPLLPASGSHAGTLLPEVANDLGLAPDLPVAAGAADTAAAALGSGLVEPGTAALTIGSGVQLVMPVAELSAAADDNPVLLMRIEPISIEDHAGAIAPIEEIA